MSNQVSAVNWTFPINYFSL